MKADSLFIGALACVNRDGLCIRKGTIIEVRGINADHKLAGKGLVGSAHCRPLDDDQFEGGIWCEYLDPIPLTPEILEKNGFKFDGSGQRSMMLISKPHFSEGIRYNIYVGLKKKTIEVFVAHPVEKSPNWRKSNKVYLEVCGLYVHELQHCLKLVGIDKEIIL